MQASPVFLDASPIISIIGGLNIVIVFETERMPDSGKSLDGTPLANCAGGKGANIGIATYHACHYNPNTGSTRDGELDGEFGTALKSKLENEGVDVTVVNTIAGERSGTCVIIFENDTGESRELAFQGTNLKWKLNNENSVKRLAGGTKPYLIVTYLAIPRERGKCAQNVTRLILNEREAAILSGRDIKDFNNPVACESVAQGFLQQGVKNMVFTLSARGTVDVVKDARVRDTTGAGDTFVRIYAVEYVRQRQLGGWDIEKAIARACKASARTIEMIGAQDSILWRNEIHELQTSEPIFTRSKTRGISYDHLDAV
ncbi:Ribokinase-like protein [Bisporella sp. PMI_857]|nr:Ribokinase-like protein [Bisporella sp. PMI_857]